MRYQRTVGALAIAAAAAALLAPAAQATPIPGPPIDSSTMKITMDGRACSGALVSNQWVLTAASCFPENPQGGTPSKAATAVFYNQQVKIVSLVTRTDRDLALAKLEIPVEQWHAAPLGTTAPTAGEAVQADGMGRTATDWVTDTIHGAPFTISGVTPTTFTSTATNGVDTCKGDAGGPMYQVVNHAFVLIGVHSTSWQHGCLGETETRSGSTDTRTDDIVGWIRQNSPGADYPNLALQKPVTVSSSHEADGWSANYLTDGSPNNGWSSESSLDKNHSESVTVDTLGFFNLGRIDLYPRNDGANTGYGFPVDFTVETSVDNQNWTKVFTRTGVSRPTSGAPLEFSLGGAATSWVRITGTNLSKDPNGQYRMQFAEIGIYGANWTANAKVTTSSTTELPKDGWSTPYVVDGVRTANGSGENGWTSAPGPAGRSEWIELQDDETDNAATHVDVYPRGDTLDGSVGFPNNFTIEGSTDGQNWTQLATGFGTAIGDGTAARRFTFPATAVGYLKVTGSGFKADKFGGYYMQLGEILLG